MESNDSIHSVWSPSRTRGCLRSPCPCPFTSSSFSTATKIIYLSVCAFDWAANRSPTASQQLLPQKIIIATIKALSNASLGGRHCPSPPSLPLTLLLAQSCPVNRGKRSAAGALLAKSWLTLTRGECYNLCGFVSSLSESSFTWCFDLASKVILNVLHLALYCFFYLIHLNSEMPQGVTYASFLALSETQKNVFTSFVRWLTSQTG